MVGRGTDRGVSQALAKRLQPLDRRVDFIGLAPERLAVDVRAAIGREHAADFVERKAGGPAQRYQRELTQHIARIAAIGIGATAIMDVWLMLLQRLGVPTLNFAMIGRWAGHWRRGVLRHDAIAKAAPVKGELALGWLMHYASGVAFAALLVGIFGVAWAQSPTVTPALCVGIATVAVPWLLMQPAMGAGIASSRTPSPAKNRARSLANHAVFGLGLYLAALLVAWISR